MAVGPSDCHVTGHWSTTWEHWMGVCPVWLPYGKFSKPLRGHPVAPLPFRGENLPITEIPMNLVLHSVV